MKIDLFKQEVLNLQKEIKELETIKTENMEDEEYYYFWHKKNNLYSWFLKYLSYWLRKYEGLKLNEFGLSVKNYNLLLKLVNEAVIIGDRTTYFNNKISRKILKLEFTYYAMNQDDYLKEF